MRTVMAIGLGLLLAVALAAAASACNVQGVSAIKQAGGWSDPVQPGDTVGWSVSRLEPGAEVTVAVEGRTLFDGTVSEGGTLSRSFTMWEAGDSARTLMVSAHIVHADIEGGDVTKTSSLNYRPAQAPAATEDPPAPQPSAPPASATAPPASATPSPSQARPPAPTRLPAAPAHARRPSATPTGRRPVIADPRPDRTFAHERAPEATRRAGAQRTTAVPAGAAIEKRAVATLPSAEPRVRVKASRGSRERSRTIGRPALRLPNGPLRVAPWIKETRDQPAAHTDPLALPLLIAIASLLAAGGAAAIVTRRPRSKGPRSNEETQPALALEAELQEIIAEARARDVHRLPQSPS